MKQYILEAKNISKSFGNVRALEDVNFYLEKGIIHGLLGENGAGKSTMIKIITGVYKQDYGDLIIGSNKQSFSSPNEANKSGISVVHQERNLIRRFSVGENLMLNNLPKNNIGLINYDEVAKQSKKWLDIMELDIHPNTIVSELTVAKMQLCEIAKALSLESKILLLDEPLVNLDYKLREQLREEFKNIFSQGLSEDSIVVFSTTDPREAMEINGEVIVLDEGKVLQVGSAKEIFENPKTLKVAEISNDPPMNILNANNDSNKIKFEGIEIDIPKHLTNLTDKNFNLGIRASDIELSDSGFEFEVELAEISGSETLLHLKRGDVKIITSIEEVMNFNINDKVKINFNTKKVKSYITGPLNKTTAYSLSANVHQSDGHTDNLTTGSNVNNRDRFGFRGELLFQPSDGLSIRVTADYDEYDEVCCAVGSTAYGVGNQIQSLMGGRIIPNNVFTQKVFYDFDPKTEGDNSGLSVHIKKDFDDMTLESISAFRNTYSYSVQDVDFDGGALVNPSPISNDRDAVSQEFRLYSNDNKKLNWLIGGYYYQEDMAFNESIYLGPLWRNYIEAFLAPGTFAGLEFLLGLPSGSIYGEGQGNTETASQDNETTSIFMQVDYNVTDRLNALIGVSYIEDAKTVSYKQVNTAVLSALDFVAIGTGVLIGGGIPAAQASVLANNPDFNPFLAFKPLQVLPKFIDFPNAAQDGKTNDDNVDYTFKLSYAINDAATIYGGISTGFKSSAWIISRDSRPDAAETAALAAAGTPVHPNTTVGRRYAGPEEAEVMELGAKIYLPSGYFNIAVFDQEIKGFQSNTFIGTGFVLANAGTQSVDGYEFDLLFSPTENIDIALSLIHI